MEPAPDDIAPAPADERAERAKESLSSRIDELGRRFRSAKNLGNLGNIAEKVVAHPWPAVGIAVAIGAFAGAAGHRGRPSDGGEHKLRHTLIAGAGALLLRLVKSYVLGQLGDQAKSWIDERVQMGDDDSSLRH